MKLYVYLKPPYNEGHDLLAVEGKMSDESTDVAMVLDDDDGDTWLIPWTSIQMARVMKKEKKQR